RRRRPLLPGGRGGVAGLAAGGGLSGSRGMAGRAWDQRQGARDREQWGFSSNYKIHGREREREEEEAMVGFYDDGKRRCSLGERVGWEDIRRI
ncbi:hypothetical protein GW17_00033315, partial [Ensete ventricosum]